MAASMTSAGCTMADRTDLRAHAGALAGRRRKIDRNAGRALEVLGHAIEYLTDEFVHAGGLDSGELEAIQILMALNRQVYSECPVVPTLSERFLSMLGAA